MGIVHGDLKCLNILVDAQGVARLTDFGLTAFSHDAQSNFVGKTAVRGESPRWTAPEVLDSEQFGLKHPHPTKASDVFSLGMVMWEIFTGRLPFYPRTQSAAAIRIRNKERPARPIPAMGLGLSDPVWAIMEQCWKHEPSERPDITTVRHGLEALLDQQNLTLLDTPSQWPLEIDSALSPVEQPEAAPQNAEPA